VIVDKAYLRRQGSKVFEAKGNARAYVPSRLPDRYLATGNVIRIHDVFFGAGHHTDDAAQSFCSTQLWKQIIDHSHSREV